MQSSIPSFQYRSVYVPPSARCGGYRNDESAGGAAAPTAGKAGATYLCSSLLSPPCRFGGSIPRRRYLEGWRSLWKKASVISSLRSAR